MNAISILNNHWPRNGRELLRLGCIIVPIIIVAIVSIDALFDLKGTFSGVKGSVDLDLIVTFAKTYGAVIISMCAVLYAHINTPSPGPGDELVTRSEYLQGVVQLQQQDQMTNQTILRLEQQAQSLWIDLEQVRSERDLYLRSPMITGDDVERLQQILVAKGYDNLLGDNGIDGMFGEDTDAAVRKFQADSKLPVTGCVTSTEWELLTRIS